MSEQSPLGDVIAKLEKAYEEQASGCKELEYQRSRRATSFFVSLGFTLITAVFFVLVADHPETTGLAVGFGLTLAGFIFMWGRTIVLSSQFYRLRTYQLKLDKELSHAVSSLSFWKKAF